MQPATRAILQARPDPVPARGEEGEPEEHHGLEADVRDPVVLAVAVHGDAADDESRDGDSAQNILSRAVAARDSRHPSLTTAIHPMHPRASGRLTW